MHKTMVQQHGAIELKSDPKDVSFDEALISFLKKAAEEGMTLQSIAVNIFDEVFNSSGIPFDGTLSSFSMLMLDRLQLRKQLGSALLDAILPATIEGMNIYRLIDRLEASVTARRRTLSERGRRTRLRRATITHPVRTGMKRSKHH